MRFLHSIPLPLLLILCSLVSFDSQAIPHGIKQSRVTWPPLGQTNYISFANSSHANGTYSRQTLTHRIARSSDNVKPVVDEELDKLSIDELEKKYKEAEEAHSKLNASVAAAKSAWEQKVAEAIGPREEYERKKKEWEEMDAAAFKEKREADKADDELNIATDIHAKASDNFTVASEALTEAQKELAKAKEDLPKIGTATTRLPLAKQELAKMKTEKTCENLKKVAEAEKKKAEKAKKKYDEDEGYVKAQQTNVDNCQSDCERVTSVLSTLISDRKKSLDIYDAANETWTNAISASEACPGIETALEEEVKDLTRFEANPNQLAETNQRIKELEDNEPKLQAAFDAAKSEEEATAKILEEKEQASEAANKISRDNPKTDEKIAVREALENLKPLEEAKLKDDEEIEKLQKEYNKLKDEYDPEDEKFGALKQVYENKKKKKDPATGSTTGVIVGSVFAVLILICIAVGIFFFMKRRKGKKEADKPSGAVGPSGGDVSTAKQGSSSNAASNASQAKEGSSKGSEQGLNNHPAAPAVAAGLNANPAAPKDADDPEAVTPQQENKFYKHVSINELPDKTKFDKEVKAHIKENIKNGMENRIRVYGKMDEPRCITYRTKTEVHLRQRIFRNYRTLKTQPYLLSACIDAYQMRFFATPEAAAAVRTAWMAEIRAFICAPGTIVSMFARIIQVEPQGKPTMEEMVVLEKQLKEGSFMIGFREYCVKQLAILFGQGREQAGRSDEDSGGDEKEQTTVAIAKKSSKKRSDKSPPKDDEERKASSRSKKETAVGKEPKRAKGERKNDSEKEKAQRKHSGQKNQRAGSGSKWTVNLNEKLNTETKHVRKLRIPEGADERHSKHFKEATEELGLANLPYGPHLTLPKEEREEMMWKAFNDESSYEKPSDKQVGGVLAHLASCLRECKHCDLSILTLKLLHGILFRASDIFKKEANVMVMHKFDVLTVVGDLHGNADDLHRILEDCGGIGSDEFMKSQFVFLGDYVDRGKFSLEIIVTLFCLKILYPTMFNVLRGNHESYDILVSYGFWFELRNRLGVEEGTRFAEHFSCCFTTMPLALVAGTYWFSHGGIPRQLCTIEHINTIPRLMNPNDNDIVRDILWADAALDLDGTEKSPRGGSHVFGDKHIDQFFEVNKANPMTTIVRAHQKQMNGYDIFSAANPAKLLTVFSACDYEGWGNSSCVLKIVNGGPIVPTMFYPRPKETEEVVRANIDNNMSYSSYVPNQARQKAVGAFKDEDSTENNRTEEAMKMGQKGA